MSVDSPPSRRSLAFSTLGCPDLDLPAAAALARRHGVQQIELRALGGTMALPDYFSARYASPAALAASVPGLGVTVAAVGTSLRLIGNTADTRDAFAAYAPWAVALGAPYLRIFDGGGVADEAELDAASATLRWWDGLKRANGWPIDVMIETHVAFSHPERLQAFLDRHPGRNILWDTHHTWRKGGEDPVQTWQRVRNAAVHLHVKDSVPRAGSATPDACTYVALGDGGFPVDALLHALDADGFAGPVSLEWERLWHPELPPLDSVLPGFVARFS